jgi:S1-C subfamily serine protease
MNRLDKVAVAVFFGIVLAVLSRQPSFDFASPAGRRPLPAPAIAPAPRVAEPAPQRIRRPLPVPASEDPALGVTVADIPPGKLALGTAFAVGRGVWLTARHVANPGCARVVMVIGGTNVLAAIGYLHPEADLALLRTKSQAMPILPLSIATPAYGETGFSFGFPSGTLGGAEGELMGRARMQLGGRLAGTAPVLAWAEVRRFPDSLESLGGISGGPMLDDDGTVVGISVAASDRRGRIFTVAPEVLRTVAAEVPSFVAGRSAAPADDEPVREVGTPPVSLIDVATELSADSRIAKTYCVPTRNQP